MKVKEIMERSATLLRPEANAQTSLEQLAAAGVSSLPVVDEKGVLVGILSEEETIRSILPTYLSSVGKFVYEENPKAVRQKVLAFPSLRVSDVMRQDVIAVSEEVTLCEAARLMVTNKIEFLPVLDGAKRVVGVLRRTRLLKALFREYAI